MSESSCWKMEDKKSNWRLERVVQRRSGLTDKQQRRRFALALRAGFSPLRSGRHRRIYLISARQNYERKKLKCCSQLIINPWLSPPLVSNSKKHSLFAFRIGKELAEGRGGGMRILKKLKVKTLLIQTGADDVTTH